MKLLAFCKVSVYNSTRPFVQGLKLVRSIPQCGFVPIILSFTLVLDSLSIPKVIHISQSIYNDRKLALTITYKVGCYVINLICLCLKLSTLYVLLVYRLLRVYVSFPLANLLNLQPLLICYCVVWLLLLYVIIRILFTSF